MLCTYLCVAQQNANYAGKLEMLIRHNDSVYNAQCDTALSSTEKLYGVPQINNAIRQNNQHIMFINGAILAVGVLFIFFVSTLVLYAGKRVRVKWHY